MNLTLLPHRTLGSTHPGGRILKCFPHPIAGSAARTVAGPTLKNERAEVRRAPARVAGREFGPRFAGRTSVFVLDTLRRLGLAPPRCSAHSMGNASSLFGGRILKCLPRSIARSAARTVAGPRGILLEEGTGDPRRERYGVVSTTIASVGMLEVLTDRLPVFASQEGSGEYRCRFPIPAGLARRSSLASDDDVAMHDGRRRSTAPAGRV